MAEFDDKLSAILGDENAMSQIMALAQSLSGPKEPAQPGEVCETQSMPEPDAGRDARLLAALRPYLKPERQGKLDRALELLQLLRLLRG